MHERGLLRLIRLLALLLSLARLLAYVLGILIHIIGQVVGCVTRICRDGFALARHEQRGAQVAGVGGIAVVRRRDGSRAGSREERQRLLQLIECFLRPVGKAVARLDNLMARLDELF